MASSPSSTWLLLLESVHFWTVGAFATSRTLISIFLSVEAEFDVTLLPSISVLGVVDKPFTKKEIDNTAKLIFIKIKIHNNYADIKSKITNTFEEVYPYDWYKSLNVEKHLLNNCTSAYGVTFVNRNNDVLIAHEMVRGGTGLDPWIYFITQEDLVESLLSTCDSKIKKIQNSSDL